MKKILVLIAIFGVFSSFSLKAETNSSWYNKFYVGAGVGFFGDIEVDYKPTGKSWAISTVKNDINVFIGYSLYKYIDVEIDYSYFLKDIQKYRYNDQSEHYGSSLLFNTKLKYTFAEKFTPFIIIGAGKNYLKDKYSYVTGVNMRKREGTVYSIGAGHDFTLKRHTFGVKYTFNKIPKVSFEEVTSKGPVYTASNNEKIDYSKTTVYYKYNFSK